MNTTFRSLFMAIIMLFVHITSTYAGEVTVPHTFQAGTPAVAAEVNQNFAAVETAINDNAADITANANDIYTHNQSSASHGGRLAHAYGFVNKNLPNEVYGSSNITSVAWNAAQEWYEIEVDGHFYFTGSQATMVTPYQLPRAFVTTFFDQGRLCVQFTDREFNPVQVSFSWVTFDF